MERVEQGQLMDEKLAVDVLFRGVAKQIVELAAGGLLLDLVNQSSRSAEQRNPGSMGWAEIGEEDGVHLMGLDPRALEGPCRQRRRRQARIDQNGSFGRT